MSLFQSQEWWGTQISKEEEFDEKHLIVDNLENDENTQNSNQIIVGSFSGFIRIYQPARGEYQINQLIYEKQFEDPVIQILTARIHPNFNNKVLIILFLKKMVAMQFSFSDNEIIGKQLFSVQLQRNAFNMTIGNFGQYKKKLIVVQSCDGLLSIYNYDQLMFTCKLYDFLLPGPICYNPIADIFVIQNINFEIEAYKYSQIGQASEQQKRVQPIWTLNLGDQILKCESVDRGKNVCDFVILTEESLYIVTKDGQIRTQKKFDYPASNFIINIPQEPKKIMDKLSNQEINSLNLIISSFTNHILVYQDFQLIWASRTDFVAHSMSIGQFGDVQGLLVLLNDEGYLSVTFLGTNPPEFHNTIQTGKKQTYESMKEQLQNNQQKLLSIENNVQSQKIDLNNMIDIKVEIGESQKTSEYMNDRQKYFKDSNNYVIYNQLKINITSKSFKITQVQIQAQLPYNLYSDNFIQSVEKIEQNESISFAVNIYCLNDQFPTQNSFDVVVSWNNFLIENPNQPDLHSLQMKVNIPMSLQCKLVEPINIPQEQITLVSQKDLSSAEQLFKSNFAFQKEEIQTNETLAGKKNIQSFLLANNVDCSILFDRKNNKLRIQSSSQQALYYILKCLDLAIKDLYGIESSLLQVEDIPLKDFFETIDTHYKFRQEYLESNQTLETLTSEFKIIQKCLLNRYKEKNPAPLNNLDVLLKKSHQNIVKTANINEQILENLKNSSKQLSINTSFIMLLFGYCFQISKENYELLQECIPSEIMNDQEEIGWEETVNSNLAYIIRMMQKQTDNFNYKLEKIEDYSKFKKHFQVVLNKLSKGV